MRRLENKYKKILFGNKTTGNCSLVCSAGCTILVIIQLFIWTQREQSRYLFLLVLFFIAASRIINGTFVRHLSRTICEICFSCWSGIAADFPVVLHHTKCQLSDRLDDECSSNIWNASANIPFVYILFEKTVKFPSFANISLKSNSLSLHIVFDSTLWKQAKW